MLNELTSIYEGEIVTNTDNRVVLKVEDLGEFGIHFTDLDKHDLKNGKKQKTISKAKGLCFLYKVPFENLAGYVYPAKLELINDSKP